MSRFLSKKHGALSPYAPGEQPRNVERFVKLNTNESPFPPSPKAVAYAAEHTRQLNLYPDPTYKALTEKLAEVYGVEPEQIVVGNGSDEILNFAFQAFCDEGCPAAFADITYGFYPVFARLNGVPYEEIPLRPDFSVDMEDYCGIGKTILLANPNSPTGRGIPRKEIERALDSNPDNVVVVDEAYVDFGGESALPLVGKYENLLVVQTFSKARSLAGGRLGYGIGGKGIIQDLNTIRNSTNPYNLNSVTVALGLGVLSDEEYTRSNCRTVMQNREYTVARLRAMGFEVVESCANFVFTASPDIEGGELYRRLKERGILIRHFDRPAISNYNRISIGAREQMDTLLSAIESILQEG